MSNYNIVCTDTTLAHHGVKGMKWGIRKERETLGVGSGNYKRTKKSTTRVTVSRKQRLKNVAKVGGAIVAAGLLAYGGYKISKIRKQNTEAVQDFLDSKIFGSSIIKSTYKDGTTVVEGRYGKVTKGLLGPTLKVTETATTNSPYGTGFDSRSYLVGRGAKVIKRKK